jgi:lipopolysaccharide transport system permease protein
VFDKAVGVCNAPAILNAHLVNDLADAGACILMPTTNTEHPGNPPCVTIRATDAAWNLHWEELSQHRELLFFLVWRDIKVRYKQTVVGVAWAIVQPLAIALSLTLFLGRAVRGSTGSLAYPVFAYAGMAVWQLFSQSVTESSNSVVNNERLISKVYFPRLFVPLAAVLASLLDFVFALTVLAVFLLVFRIVPTGKLALAPLFVLLTLVPALGTGLWLSALNVKYRDVRYTLSFLVQFWFFASPIAYPLAVVPEGWRFVYMLNPMVGAIEGFRWTLQGGTAFPWLSVALGITTGVSLFATGLIYFRHTEDTFADFI